MAPPDDAGGHHFALRVPESYVGRMRPGDEGDPLLRQVLPSPNEQVSRPGFGSDPVGDLDSMAVPGLLHKYAGRVLLIATGACAIHCRYCFRRHFPYSGTQLRGSRLRAAIAYIRGDRTIREVILSGGDPLSLGNERLAVIVEALAEIPHVATLRVHTRTPVASPQRVDPGLRRCLAAWPRAKVVVVHANHPQELDGEVAAAADALAGTGARLLNQAVLLRGVNDRLDTLATLSRRLFEIGILPYYLHLLDPVAGSAHFEVPESEGRRLVAALAAQLPGYLVPRLAREVAGAASKRWLEPVENIAEMG